MALALWLMLSSWQNFVSGEKVTSQRLRDPLVCLVIMDTTGERLYFLLMFRLGVAAGTERVR